MKKLDQYITEKLVLNRKSPINARIDIVNDKNESREDRLQNAFEVLTMRYKNVFNNIEISESGECISLGALSKETHTNDSDSSYIKSTFMFYINDRAGGFGVHRFGPSTRRLPMVNLFRYVDDFKEALNKFEEILTLKGFTLKIEE
jgi:hypothetical protein